MNKQKIIEVPKKIKILYYYNGDRVSTIFNLAKNKEINDIFNSESTNQLIEVTKIVINQIINDFKRIKEDLQLPILFTDIQNVGLVLLPVLIGKKTKSSLQLNIDDTNIGMDIITYDKIN